MNASTIIIAALLAAAVIAILLNGIRNRKKGACTCGGACSTCGAGCHRQETAPKQEADS